MHIGFFDGSASPNPGKIGLGACICFQQTVICKSAKPGGTGTNNVAEYKALIHLLELAIAMKIKKLTVYGDSQLVVNQVNGVWTVNAGGLRQYYDRVKDMQSAFTEFALKWVSRKRNGIADKLSREGLELTKVKTVHIQVDSRPDTTRMDTTKTTDESFKKSFAVHPLGSFQFRIEQNGNRAIVVNLKKVHCTCDDYRKRRKCVHLESIVHIMKKRVA